MREEKEKMSKILSQREGWIIRRKDGKILCGLARDYTFKAPEKLKDTAIKTYRSKRQALAAFAANWGEPDLDVEAVKVKETLEIVE